MSIDFSKAQEEIFSPAGWGFIVSSLFVAFMLNIMPWGQLYGVPDFLAITLLFWSIHQHRRVGIGIAFCFGLLMDVNNATFLGETALAYTLMTYFERIGCEALLLGCTHFPYIKDALAACFSRPIIDPAEEMVKLLLA